MNPKAKRPAWAGQTVAVLASGPSLTLEDCKAVREAGWISIVTNATFELCPWAEVLYGFDAKFWEVYGKRVDASFSGRLVCHVDVIPGRKVETTKGCEWFRGVGNSGACALGLALAGLPSRVVLLGCDSQKCPESGKVHHHGSHPPGMSNGFSMARWPKAFYQMAAEAKMLRIPVINASRATALTCFPRAQLSELLAEPVT